MGISVCARRGSRVMKIEGERVFGVHEARSRPRGSSPDPIWKAGQQEGAAMERRVRVI